MQFATLPLPWSMNKDFTTGANNERTVGMDALVRNPQDEDSAFDALHESCWLVIAVVCLIVTLLALAGCCHCKPTPKPTPVIEKKTASPTAPVISPAPKPEPIVLQEVKPK